MPYSYNFGGGYTNRNAYVYGGGHPVKSEFGGFPAGNLDSGGGRPVKIYGISVIGLSGGYPLLWFAGQETGGGGVFHSPSGGGFAIRCISNSGQMNFGRLSDNGVHTIDEWDGSVWDPRGSLCGWFTWATVAFPPSMVSADAGSGGAITVKFSGSGNTGGMSMDAWQLQYDTNSSFSSPVTISSSGTSTITGTPGSTYWFRARGHNDVGWTTWSGAISELAVGAPSAPQNLTGVVSTSIANAINLDWAAPAVPGGTITGYKIYKDGVHIHTTSGTGSAYTVTGLTRNDSSQFNVRARNAYSDSKNTQSAASNTVTVTAHGTPNAPGNMTAVPDGVNPGEIDLSWTAPTYTGVGGLTGYEVYRSTGQLLSSSVPAGTTTYTVTGLTPGVQYGFYVRGKNAISTASGTPGTNSATAYATSLGDPAKVTGLTASIDPKVVGRVVLAWTAPAIGVGAVVGYSVFDADTHALLGKVTGMTFVIDDLQPGLQYRYYVRARNTVTEQTGSLGGPVSDTVVATPGATSSQATGTLVDAVVDNTNVTFSGAKTVSAITGETQFTYMQAGADLAPATSGGSITNTTNTALNGTYTVGLPTPTSITYSKTTPNIVATPSNGELVNNTNAVFNGTHLVTAVDAVNKLVSYAKTNANITTRTVPSGVGTIINNTNTTFNGTGFTITGVTPNTFSYARTAANVVEISATGTATDTTNRDFYNGTYTVLDVPAYNIFTYRRVE